MAYATQTSTRRNLDALRAAGWRLLLSPVGDLRTKGFSYGLDNGAWSYHQQNAPFDCTAFERACELVGRGADWIVVPDIVMGGIESLELSRSWLQRLREYGTRLLIPVQDGMQDEHLAPLLSPMVGVFVGGSTDFKEQTMARWTRLAHAFGGYCHVGRVNTLRRIRICAAAGADSFDGTSATRYAVTLPKLDACRRVPDLFAGQQC